MTYAILLRYLVRTIEGSFVEMDPCEINAMVRLGYRLTIRIVPCGSVRI